MHFLRSLTFHMQLVPDTLYNWMSGLDDEVMTVQCISDCTKTRKITKTDLQGCWNVEDSSLRRMWNTFVAGSCLSAAVFKAFNILLFGLLQMYSWLQSSVDSYFYRPAVNVTVMNGQEWYTVMHMNSIEWPLILSDKVVTIWKLHSKRNTVILRNFKWLHNWLCYRTIDGALVRIQGDT